MKAPIELEATALATLGLCQVLLQFPDQAIARKIREWIAALLGVPVEFGLHAGGDKSSDGLQKFFCGDKGVLCAQITVYAHFEVLFYHRS